VKFCSIEFTDNPVSTLRVVACVRTQQLGAADPHSTADCRSDTCILVSLRFGHGDITYDDNAVQFCTQKKQTVSVPNPEGHTAAALLRVLPTYSGCSIMFCPHSVCSQQF